MLPVALIIDESDLTCNEEIKINSLELIIKLITTLLGIADFQFPTTKNVEFNFRDLRRQGNSKQYKVTTDISNGFIICQPVKKQLKRTANPKSWIDKKNSWTYQSFVDYQPQPIKDKEGGLDDWKENNIAGEKEVNPNKQYNSDNS